ncbi:MAG: restriction endonuclease subunit S [Salinivirgaceae bacterium]|nr:restriction endonuclease subunit S [Salinivirgaceae bacterium]
MELKVCKLGEICKLSSAKRIYENEYVLEGIPFIRGQEVSDKSILNPNARFDCYISRERYIEIKNKYGVPQKGDILMTAVGTIGNLVVLDTDREFYFKDGNLIRFSSFKDVVNSTYLALFMQSPFFKKQIAMSLIGAMQKALTMVMLNEIEVTLPPLDIQRQIASVLSNLDRKIALNRAINRNLEAMAKQLYDYWFVQFDFPNAEGKPYKSSGGKMVWNETLKREIPEGWKVKRFGDVVTLKRGISYSKDNLSDCGRPMISLASFAPDSTYKVNSIKHFNGDVKDSDFLAPFDILLCTTQQTEIDYKTDIVGKTIYVPDIFDESSVFTTDLVKVEVDKEIGSVILYETKKDWYNKYITGFASGTSIKHLDTKGFLSYPLAMPNDSVLHSFFKMMNTFQKRQSILLNDNIILQQQRDFLLPLLMNGQVSIK